MRRPLYQALAALILARQTCEKTGNAEWQHKHTARALDLTFAYMPSGSGFDCATQLNISDSKPEKLVFLAQFHHMDECGSYDGWTEHRVTVTPSLVFGFDVQVSGSNRNQIKNYIAETFSEALSQEIAE